VYNFALDAWDEKPGLPKALVPVQNNLEYLMRKQYGYGYMVFFNINVCRNNIDDVRRLTEYAHDHRIATDYHINETPMLEQDEHFTHLSDDQTYIRPEDGPEIDSLLDWLSDRNEAGYQMVNSIQRLQEMKAFMRMSSGVDLKRFGWNGDGTGANGDITNEVASMPGIEQDEDGELRFTEWNCRAGQNNVIIRPDGTVAPCFPMYPSTYGWGNIDEPKVDAAELARVKKICQRHCFSMLNHNLAYCYLNHNLAYCYNDARVIRWVWTNLVKNRARGGARSFE
jgi:radical SAM protein with 4Fe4S-binding SPASM domain